MRCLLVLAAVLAPALSAADSIPPRLSAEQIVARNVEARGGLEAWRKVETMLWLGHIESAHATTPGMQFMLAQQRPDKTHFEINAMGDRSLRVFDGTRGWKMRASHGQPVVEPYTSQEVRFAQDGPGIDGLLIGYADKPGSVEVRGIDDIEKRYAYHLMLHTASGDTQHVWVDAKTFLEVRYDRAAPGASGASRTVSVLYRDYKDTGGLKIPSIIETGAGAGVTPDKMVIEKVMLNPRLDARAFSAPGERTRQAREQTGVPFPRHRPRAPGGGLPPSLTPPPGSPPQATSPSSAESPTPPSSPAPGSTSPPSRDPGSTPE